MEQWKYILNLAEKLCEENKEEEAMTLLKQYLHEEPDRAEIHNKIACLYLYSFQKNKEAIEYFNWSIKFNPTFVPALFNLAYLYHKTNEQYKAIDLLKRALAGKNADRPEILYRMGQCYEALYDWTQAANAYRQAILECIDSWNSSSLEESLERVKRKKWMKLINLK
jgi:tetratricopeptide (TPR) repeat protein